MSNNWQYTALKIVSRLISLLPYSMVLAVGSHIGKLYYRIAAKQRKRALAQIKESLNLSDTAAENTIRSLFIKLGQTFLEVMYMPALTPARAKELVEIENRHYLADALGQGKGVVFLTAHIGNWEWLGATLAMDGFPMTSVIRRQPNDQYTRILNEYRQKAGIEIFAKGSAELVGAAKALKQGKILGFLADQDGGSNGIFLEFLGKMASTPPGAAVFAKKFKTPVVPVFIVRRPQGGHRILMHPPLYYEDTGDENRDLYNLIAEMTRITEETIRQYPDEWLWFQKRWNTKFENTQAAKSTMAGETV